MKKAYKLTRGLEEASMKIILTKSQQVTEDVRLIPITDFRMIGEELKKCYWRTAPLVNMTVQYVWKTGNMFKSDGQEVEIILCGEDTQQKLDFRMGLEIDMKFLFLD